jgi:hypothetical protein
MRQPLSPLYHPTLKDRYLKKGDLEGDANGAPHPDASSYANKFSGRYEHKVIEGGIGHNLPQEAPQPFAEAVVEVDGY